ncbi:hypothetical protein [Ruminococcus flavefaciens]|uniref:Uncharacterized protein n=1 Tax=Ruminococcus flavefaciens TaxID=1265 RepID=A0A315Y1T9_RUMFL|nr:hypothetical protein [Ruminococcus flavefaciens]PWJ13977.1 hypothetical protein IE37_00908 [Ruminococcus flavefaciens]SSA43560.1 hypothetical protein SAMN02910325_00908 [Ruminococcus flavefaciens]
MGKKIDFDTALKLGGITPNDTIYAKPNSYGYKLNVNHPQILPLYERYKKKLGEKILSDTQRLTFETMIFKALQKKKEKEVEQCD